MLIGVISKGFFSEGFSLKASHSEKNSFREISFREQSFREKSCSETASCELSHHPRRHPLNPCFRLILVDFVDLQFSVFEATFRGNVFSVL